MTKRTEICLWLVAALLLVAEVAWPATGYQPPPGAQACYETASGPRRCFTLNASARPWGPTGNGLLKHDVFVARYFGGTYDVRKDGYWAQGFCCELTADNQLALRNWCQATQTGHDCISTEEEQFDLATTTPRRGDFYRRWWYEPKPGGTRDHPIVIDLATARSYSSVYSAAMAEGTWDQGVIATVDPVWRWTKYLDVQLPCNHPWMVADAPACGGTPPPPPPPSWSCPWWEARYQDAPFDWMRARGWSAQRAAEWVLKTKPDGGLAASLRKKCNPVEPPPPPDPKACANGLDDDGDGLVDMADPGCEGVEDDDETDAVEPPPPPVGEVCTEWTVRVFVPRVESTGKSRMVVVGEGECE